MRIPVFGFAKRNKVWIISGWVFSAAMPFISPSRFSMLPPFEGDPPRRRVYQLPPPAIQYLTAYCEAADGIGLVRTLDESRGLVECWIMADFEIEFDGLLRALRVEWPLQQIEGEFE